MKLADLLTRVDQLIADGKNVLATRYSSGDRYPVAYIKDAPMAGFRSGCMSFIDRVYGQSHPHYGQFTAAASGTYLSDAERAIAILESIRSEIAGGWLFTVKGLVTAELFSDFLDMAEHLLEEHYKDPAAVVIGSVLEEHLRQLCTKHSISLDDVKEGKQVPRKADRLNAELKTAGAYTALDQKQITAWLAIRNNAAHGKYQEYNAQQVRNFLSGVVEFISRVPS